MAISSTVNQEVTTAPAITSNEPKDVVTETSAAPTPTIAPIPKPSIDTSRRSLTQNDADAVDNTEEFSGELNTTNTLPTVGVLKKIEGMVVLDQDGKTVPFKDLYNGPNVARRVLVIFIRHFFCGNCQEFIRTLTSSITPTELLQLPTPTFIAIVGCGNPSLIGMWQKETQCPFPCYADPTKKLYDELGMMKTLSLGKRPEYQRQSLASLMTGGFVQSVKMLTTGKVFQGGGYHQVGGEFLFEPINDATPITTPLENDKGKQLGEDENNNGDVGRGGYVEEKRITWCHRMRTTRDHAEIPELREVLGLEGEGPPGNDPNRWSKALTVRKGTGLSTASTVTASASSSSNGQASTGVEQGKVIEQDKTAEQDKAVKEA